MATPLQIPTPESKPKLSYRAQRDFELREASFGASSDEAINKWVWEQIDARRKQLEILHKQKVPEWRRIASGEPREKNKSWPFENCSNLVHPIVAESRDELAARVIQLIFAISPIAIYRYFTKSKSSDEAHHNTEKAKCLEQFIDYVSYEPGELDLYRVENLWFADSTDLGTAWVCAAPEKRVEAVYVGYDTGKKAKKFEHETLYEGPKVINCRYEDVLYDPDANTPEDSVFLSRKVTLNRRDLQERVFKGHYRKKDVEKILNKPDHYGPGEVRKRENSRKGITSAEDRILAEWDIEECYFYWYHNSKKYRLIAWYHFETKTMCNQVFNFIPENQIPLVRTRLSLNEHGMNGRGFADMGRDAQEEISTAKNQRNDATTWMMLGINRLSPQNKNIDKNMKVFPGATMPFGNGEFEHLDVGNVGAGQLSLQNEQAMIQQARERFGVGPAVAGSGAGGVDKKGKYTGSMGTLAIMQDANSRNAHRTSDFRHSHIKLISLLTDMYGAMGLGRKGSLFGLDDQLLDEALSDFLERKVRIPIRAASASANKEVTKQNQMLFMNLIENYVKAQSGRLQAIAGASLPPNVIKWMTETIKGQQHLLQAMVRDFQLSDQPEEYVPNIEFPEDDQHGEKPQGPDPRLIEMANRLRKPGGVPVPGGQPGLPGAGGGMGGPASGPDQPPGA